MDMVTPGVGPTRAIHTRTHARARMHAPRARAHAHIPTERGGASHEIDEGSRMVENKDAFTRYRSSVGQVWVIWHRVWRTEALHDKLFSALTSLLRVLILRPTRTCNYSSQVHASTQWCLLSQGLESKVFFVRSLCRHCYTMNSLYSGARSHFAAESEGRSGSTGPFISALGGGLTLTKGAVYSGCISALVHCASLQAMVH